MTLDELLPRLFPEGTDIARDNGVLTGTATLRTGGTAAVIGLCDGAMLGVDEAICLSGHVLDVIDLEGEEPILVLIDAGSQQMSKRDELLGLSEFLSHLAKCLMWAGLQGRPTISILYGGAAAGAFIATALATGVLVALPDAAPVVMDLPSMAKVTKLSLEVLTEKSKSTPVFAPGLHNLVQTGAVHEVWADNVSLADQLSDLLTGWKSSADRRDQLGEERNGRPKAASVSMRVHDLVIRA